MKNSFLLIIFFLTFGCSNPDAALKEENKELKSQRADFSKRQTQESKRYNSTIDSLRSNEQFLISVLPASLSRDTLLKMAVDEILTGGDEKYNDILWSLSSIVNENRHENSRVLLKGDVMDVVKLRSKDFFLYYVWKNLDKREENIRSYFNSKSIEYAATLIKDNYESGGLSQLAEALLIAYQEMEGKDKLLDDLYLRADTIHVLADPAYGEIVSPKVKALLQEDYSDDPIIDAETRCNWVYSFWVRRHYEQNAEVVYELISLIDSKVRELIEDENDDYEE